MSETNTALLTGIWSRLLQTSPIAPEDNFFDLGGDSLLAVNMFLEIERATGRHFEITTIYDAPTISELAGLMETETVRGFSSLVKLKSGEGAPFFIVHGIGGTVVELASLGKAIAIANPRLCRSGERHRRRRAALRNGRADGRLLRRRDP